MCVGAALPLPPRRRGSRIRTCRWRGRRTGSKGANALLARATGSLLQLPDDAVLFGATTPAVPAAVKSARPASRGACQRRAAAGAARLAAASAGGGWVEA